MIILDLFLGFLQVGCLAFGAYGAIPLLRDIVLSAGWLTDEMMTYIVAVSESTPGPIMINIATYVGSSQAGPAGAAMATLAVVLPSYIIILLLTVFLQDALKNPYVKAVLQGLKPCVIGIILATGTYLIISNCFPCEQKALIDFKAVLTTALLTAACFAHKRITGKKLSPILLIVLAAGLGTVIY